MIYDHRTVKVTHPLRNNTIELTKNRISCKSLLGKLRFSKAMIKLLTLDIKVMTPIKSEGFATLFIGLNGSRSVRLAITNFRSIIVEDRLSLLIDIHAFSNIHVFRPD